MTNEELEGLDKKRVVAALGLLAEKEAQGASSEAEDERFIRLSSKVPAGQWTAEDRAFVQKKGREIFGL